MACIMTARFASILVLVATSVLRHARAGSSKACRRPRRCSSVGPQGSLLWRSPTLRVKGKSSAATTHPLTERPRRYGGLCGDPSAGAALYTGGLAGCEFQLRLRLRDDHVPSNLDFVPHAGQVSAMSDPVERRPKDDTVAPWRRDAQTALLFGFFVLIAGSGVELLISAFRG